MKQYKTRNGKVIVTEVKVDDLKELETIKLIEDTYQDSSKSNVDDYLSIHANKLA